MLRGTDPMALAGAGIMSGYWDEAAKHQRDVRDAANSEAVHDMRVAVRRLRVAFALFAPWYAPGELRGFKKDLRRLGRRLGAVRDGEVLIKNAQDASRQLPNADLDGVLARWEAEHAVARVRLLDYLDGSAFARFSRRFERFLQRHESTAATETAIDADAADFAVEPHLVCDVMPAEIWKRYGSVHAYLPVALEASAAELHRLRIAGKQLRYAVESFQDLLGTSGKRAVGSLREMQDVLGAVHDAYVAIDLLETFQATRAGPNDAVEPYIEQQRSVLATSRARFESLWPAISGARLREHIAGCAGALAGLSERSSAEGAPVVD